MTPASPVRHTPSTATCTACTGVQFDLRGLGEEQLVMQSLQHLIHAAFLASCSRRCPRILKRCDRCLRDIALPDGDPGIYDLRVR
jgi:hypothetical protein